jgi:hypothetical protein
MKRATLLLTVILLALCSPASALAAEEPLTPGDIVEDAHVYDDASVWMQGEAIGESLRADAEHRWANVLGGGVALGVYMPSEMAEEIAHFGDYRTFGDTVAIRGLVNVSCPQHGGEFDMHAEELVIVESGGPRDNPTHPWKLAAGLGLLVVGAVEYRLYRVRKNRGPV